VKDTLDSQPYQPSTGSSCQPEGPATDVLNYKEADVMETVGYVATGVVVVGLAALALAAAASASDVQRYLKIRKM
jgi:hypothetical protein